MVRPLVGILTNRFLINDEYPVHVGGTMTCDALVEVSGCTPVLVPADPEAVKVPDIVERLDGFLFPGARANVHPDLYGIPPSRAHGDFDRPRDHLAVELLNTCVERGQPVLAICRGFQEMNVAFGGSLHPEIREIPGRANHRMPPDGTLEEKFELRHYVTFSRGGPFHALMGAERVETNTLHGQGIDRPGERVAIDGWADDGTPEAIYIKDAPGFAMGVQWHPEWNASGDPVSRPLFDAFGAAARDWARGRRPTRLRLA